MGDLDFKQIAWETLMTDRSPPDLQKDVATALRAAYADGYKNGSDDLRDEVTARLRNPNLDKAEAAAIRTFLTG